MKAFCEKILFGFAWVIWAAIGLLMYNGVMLVIMEVAKFIDYLLGF